MTDRQPEQIQTWHCPYCEAFTVDLIDDSTPANPIRAHMKACVGTEDPFRGDQSGSVLP